MLCRVLEICREQISNTPITHTNGVLIGLTLVITSLRRCTANHVLFEYIQWLFLKHNKNKETLARASRQMNLEDAVLSEMSQSFSNCTPGGHRELIAAGA